MVVVRSGLNDSRFAGGGGSNPATLGVIGVGFRCRHLVTAGKVSAAEVTGRILDRR